MINLDDEISVKAKKLYKPYQDLLLKKNMIDFEN